MKKTNILENIERFAERYLMRRNGQLYVIRLYTTKTVKRFGRERETIDMITYQDTDNLGTDVTRSTTFHDKFLNLFADRQRFLTAYKSFQQSRMINIESPVKDDANDEETSEESVSSNPV